MILECADGVSFAAPRSCATGDPVTASPHVPPPTTASLGEVVRQHAEEASMLRETRAAIATASAVRLFDFVRTDERIRAHLDGLAVAGPDALTRDGSPLPEEPTSGSVFVATVSALDSGTAGRVHDVIASGAGSENVRRGVIWALAWTNPRRLKGVVANLLVSERPTERRIGVNGVRSASRRSWSRERPPVRGRRPRC